MILLELHQFLIGGIQNALTGLKYAITLLLFTAIVGLFLLRENIYNWTIVFAEET